MISFLHNGLYDVVPFLLILTVLVFVHEFGHYYIARRNGVRIEVFSIGFGPELFGWWDKAGTRWKFSAIPLGGYVKMFGDSDASSLLPVSAGVAPMSASDRDASFHYKRLGQRAAIVAAGPGANFLFAIIALALLFMTYGEPYTPPEVGQVSPDSAAAKAGIKPDDVIVSLAGRKVQRFEDVQETVRMNPDVKMPLVVNRHGELIKVEVVPDRIAVSDRLGNHYAIGRLGISRNGVKYLKRDPASAVLEAGRETWTLSVSTLKAVWQIAIGTRATDELGGPLRIAQMSGEVARGGIVAVVWFLAVLSINLGLINLFPVPVLDGGHLLFYAAEAVRGRPLGQRAQEYGFRIGLAVVFTLMIFATWNDLVHLGLPKLW